MSHGFFWSCAKLLLKLKKGEQGWRSGESARLPPMWPGFESRTGRQMWVEFVVGSRPCSERFFSGYFGFPLSSKTNISKFQFDLDTVDGAVARALVSHQCGPGSSPGLGVRCGLSLLLVLVLAPRGFFPGTPVFPSPQKPTFLNSSSIWTQWTKSHLADVPLLIPILNTFVHTMNT